MTSIEDIIRQEVNPFGTIIDRHGNFWREKQDSGLTVESIHQEAVVQIETLLDRVANDHHSRTVLLTGDPGSGKSYLLGRLKRTLNPKAFFAYIGPWPDNDYIRRYILRYTVDSLMQVSEGEEESQLMLWLKSLSAFTNRTLKQRIFDDNFWNSLRSNRQNFVAHLRKTYKEAGIYNADNFFGVLYALNDPELYPLACDWLRGDDLSEESLQALKVKRCIDTEDAAWETLSNLSRIATETQPIVLCFDQIEEILLKDPQPLFSVNTAIHNESLKNFLVIISVVTQSWREHNERIQQSDRARIEQKVNLKNITLNQAEALWNYRLQPIHRQANPQPPAPIFPLTRQLLENKYPGGKTDPRNALQLGRQEYEIYKNSLIPPGTTPPPPPPPPEEEFKLIWLDEFKKAQSKITKITLLSAPELIRMLEEALAALQIAGIKSKLLSGKYASYSFSYQQPGQQKRVGVIWTEDSNMNSFVHVMNACEKVIQQSNCENLYLIRAASVGNSKLVGNQIYRQIFTGSPHRHIKPTLSSVHYLAAYYSLVNSAVANELVVARKTINLKQLQELVRKLEIFGKCRLLHDLGIVKNAEEKSDETDSEEIGNIKNFLLSLVRTQGFMGINILIKNAVAGCPQASQQQIDHQIKQLIWERKIKIVNPNDPPQNQLVCFVPKK